MSDALTSRLRRLTDLSEADLRRLERACSAGRHVEMREDILRPGQPSEGLMVVLDGWAARYKTLADGRQQYPALVLPGEVCNLDAVLMDRLDYGVVALTPCWVAVVPRAELRAMLDDSPPLRDAVWWLTLVENSIASEWALSLGKRSAVERLAHLFCELQVRLAAGEMAEAGRYTLPLTQQAIGDAIGISAVHVNRAMMRLRGYGLISREDRQLTIVNWDGLRALADFRPSYLHLEGMRRSRAA